MFANRHGARRPALYITGLAIFASLTAATPAIATTPPGAAGALWEASLEGTHGVAPEVTVREIARVSVAGFGIRVRLGNPCGAGPLVVRDAWLGRTVAPGAARPAPGSNHRLTFHGSATVTVPAGQEVVSDAVPTSVEAQQDVAVS